LNNLARLYRAQQKYQERASLQRALAIYERVFGSEHPDIALMMTNLEKLYLHKGNDQQAQPLLERAVAISEQTFGLSIHHRWLLGALWQKPMRCRAAIRRPSRSTCTLWLSTSKRSARTPQYSNSDGSI